MNPRPMRLFRLAPNALVVLATASLALVACRVPIPYQPPPADSYAITTVTLNTNAWAATVKAALVSPDFFERVQAHPLLGRFWVKGDSNGPLRVVVLSYDLWNGHFGAAPGAIGQHLEVDGQAAMVVGVAPRDLRVPETARLWILK